VLPVVNKLAGNAISEGSSSPAESPGGLKHDDA
jgi:hypothetical protein